MAMDTKLDISTPYLKFSKLSLMLTKAYF